MKQKDLITVIASVVVAGIFSFVICSQFITSSASKNQKVEVVQPISAEFNLPDKKIFNTEAINPTKLIEIAPNTNNLPFANQ